MTGDGEPGAKYLPGGGLRPLQSDPCDQYLTREQRKELIDVCLTADKDAPPLAFLRSLVARIGGVLDAKVAVVGKHEGRWVVAAESTLVPPVPARTSGGVHAFDRLIAKGVSVEPWRAGDSDWTLVGLSSPGGDPVILVVEGEWIHCSSVFREMARALSDRVSRELPVAKDVLDTISRRLTRALADAEGIAAVGDLMLRHVVQAVPCRMASLAVANPDGELSIVATHGYPRALVEHLRIMSGRGVIGAVHQSRAPLLVSDVTSEPGLDRHRSRYRTKSFVAVPIVAGDDVLGVVSMTDRLGPGPFTHEDIETVSVLMGPAALALARERAWKEAHAYAQAAVIDPVSGLFNRRYFEARLEEELQRAIRQTTSVALLIVDLDEFKSINDRFGHMAGDLVIRDISEILRRSVRIFDVCTRFGGEEFAVMMPGGTAESAGVIAERIRHRVEAYHRGEPDLSALHVTASIGVAVSPPGMTARELIERADRALYHAKKAGKNRVSIAAPQGAVSSSELSS